MFEQGAHVKQSLKLGCQIGKRKCAKFNCKFNILLMCPSSKSLTCARHELYRLDASQNKKHSYFMVSLLLLSYKIYVCHTFPQHSQVVSSYLSLQKVLHPFYKLKLSVQTRGKCILVEQCECMWICLDIKPVILIG